MCSMHCPLTEGTEVRDIEDELLSAGEDAMEVRVHYNASINVLT